VVLFWLSVSALVSAPEPLLGVAAGESGARQHWHWFLVWLQVVHSLNEPELVMPPQAEQWPMFMMCMLGAHLVQSIMLS
jgi:hypothetical protein